MRDEDLFGTDGIRGQVGRWPFVPSAMADLGVVIGSALSGPYRKMVIGADTRASGPFLVSALAGGVMAQGVNVVDAGVVSTPALSFLTAYHKADFGVMVSASHNLYQDNGIKLFDFKGEKVSEEVEQVLSKRFIQRDFSCSFHESGHLIARPHRGYEPYLEHLRSVFSNLQLSGIKIILDCAHGALSSFALSFLESFGAQVIGIANQPDGCNINAHCGATSPHFLQEAVLYHEADVGFAFDGDGDRVMACNRAGDVLDGDQIMAILINQYLTIVPPSECQAVLTVMSNLGFKNFLKTRSVLMHETPVGDKFVAHKMSQVKAKVGGEPSGHIILPEYSLVGDGLLVACKLLEIYQKKGELSSLFSPVPHKLDNIVIKNRKILDLPEWLLFLQDLRQQHENDAHILIRLSGTEPVVRVFVQTNNQEALEEIILSCRLKISKLDHDAYIVS